MIDLLASIVVPFGFLLSLAYLVVICIRKRLPFYEAEIVETRLEAAPPWSFSRFVVRFERLQSGGRIHSNFFVFAVSGAPEKARDSRRYAELKEYYSVGKTVKVRYVPNAEWLFGTMPDSQNLPSSTMPVSIMAVLFGVVIVLLYLAGDLR